MKVWQWKEWPYKSPTGVPWRWKEDECGIDLVALHQDGTLWAIQAKAYAESGTVTMHDMSQFLAESSRSLFSHRLLIATTNHVAYHAQDVATGSEKSVGIVNREFLESAELDWPESFSNLFAAPKPSVPKEPTGHWAYQADAMNDVVNRFLEGLDRGQLIMACGTGKTLTANYIREREELAAQRVLVTVPSLALMRQTIREVRANQRVDFKLLPVCSDDGVRKDPEAAVSSTSELGLPVTTDPEKIAKFLRGKGPRVVFSTYQSTPEIAKAFQLKKVPHFDLVIADEAHRTAGPVASAFATILDDKKIKALRRLFMTATPKIFTARVVEAGDEADYQIASMDDEAKYGKVFHCLSFGKAIEQKLLTDFQVVIMVFDKATDPDFRELYEKYREWVQKRRFVRIGDDDESRMASDLAARVAVLKAMRYLGCRRGIVYTNTIARGQEFAEDLRPVNAWMPADQRFLGHVWTASVDGTMSVKKRDAILKGLVDLDKDTAGVVTNARCLGEGIDVPSVDFIMIVDPKRSPIEIAQAAGRPIRLAPGKEIATILLPLLVDSEQDVESAFNTSAFSAVRNTLLAMRSLDPDRLGERIDTFRRERGKQHGGEAGRQKMLPNLSINISDKVSEDFARAIEVKIVELTSTSFEEYVGAYEQFYAEHGHGLVPDNYQADNGLNLGCWVHNQRAFKVRGSTQLTPEREQRLNDLPGWEWEGRDAAWKMGWRYAQDYRAEKGHIRPRAREMFKGFKIGQWVNVQRTIKVQGKLSDERIQLLEQIDGWTWDLLAEQWEEGFRRLQEYVQRNGDARAPVRYKTENGYPLGKWVDTQRRFHSRDNLDEDRVRRLEELSDTWTWDLLAEQWEEGFRRLQEYVQRNGDARVPSTHKEADGYKLGLWVVNQRAKHRKDDLEDDRVRRLKGLDGWSWNTKADLWEEGFARLRQYVDSNGSATLISHAYVTDDGYGLGHWVAKQRFFYTKGDLDPDRENRLKKVTGWVWSAMEARWEEGFSRLQDYVRDNGSIPGATTEVGGYKVGSWAVVQRARHKKDKLTADQVHRLGGLDGWEWALKSGPR